MNLLRLLLDRAGQTHDGELAESGEAEARPLRSLLTGAWVHDDRRDLHSGFLKAADAYPDRTALEVAGAQITYAELRARAASIAATLARHPVGGPRLTAVLARRSATAFAGVLGALMRGHGYVPLNPTFPAERLRRLLARAGCRTIVVDAAAAAVVDEVLTGADVPMVVVLPDTDDVTALRDRWRGHVVVGAGGLEPATRWEPTTASTDDVAYVLFTSGTTGVPKGVTVSHRSALHVTGLLAERYGIDEHDRLSQTFELTFDPSVFDMFVAWSAGAALCCLPAKALIAPGRFIRDAALSVWFSVPSMAVFMRRLGMLKAGSYPTLRLSLFAGEPLPVDLARAWAEAAPGSVVENLYGPTELTVVCTGYRWDPASPPAAGALGLVPIGLPFAGSTALVVDEALEEVSSGADGELVMAGPQVASGYWNDPEGTAASFVVPPGQTAVHYRTGDRVWRGPDGVLHYVGRLDDQVKVQGQRVELGEVEAALREAAAVDGVVALGWPRTETGARAIAAFLEEPAVSPEELRRRLGERLPEFMVPRRIEYVERLPVNANGKFDRAALVRMLEAPS